MTNATQDTALAALLWRADDLIERWHSPKWKDEPHTAEYINRLQAAVEAVRRAPAPVEEGGSLNAADAGGQKPYAYEFGKPNGDGTYSVVIERGDMVKVGAGRYEYGPPTNAVKDRPIKPLYDRADQADAQAIERAALERAARICESVTQLDAAGHAGAERCAFFIREQIGKPVAAQSREAQNAP